MIRFLRTNPPGSTARALVLALLAAAAGCTVDTELGVAAVVDAASVQVTGAGASAVIAVDLTVSFRVGEHASGERTFVPQRTELYVGEGAPVALINLERPAGFDGTLSPGESRTITFHGATPPGAFDATPLCTGAPTVQVLVRWDDTTASEIGMTTATTMMVACSP